MALTRQELRTAARVHGEVNFAHGAAQSRAIRFQDRIWSTDDDDAARTALRDHLRCHGTKTFLGCARCTVMTMPTSNRRWRCPACTNCDGLKALSHRGRPLILLFPQPIT